MAQSRAASKIRSDSIELFKQLTDNAPLYKGVSDAVFRVTYSKVGQALYASPQRTIRDAKL